MLRNIFKKIINYKVLKNNFSSYSSFKLQSRFPRFEIPIITDNFKESYLKIKELKEQYEINKDYYYYTSLLDLIANKFRNNDTIVNQIKKEIALCRDTIYISIVNISDFVDPDDFQNLAKVELTRSLNVNYKWLGEQYKDFTINIYVDNQNIIAELKLKLD